MARKRKDPSAASIKLQQPDRSAPTEKTLLDFAQERQLFEQADKKQKANKRASQKPSAGLDGGDDDGDDEPAGFSPAMERLGEAVLWTSSLAALHFTLDVLVQNQYGVDILWPSIVLRSLQAFFIFLMLFYPFHPHPSNPILLPGLPTRFQHPLRQAIFFAVSVGAGCYLINISNVYSYLAVMKRAPPLGCLWVWSVIELELPAAVASLACAGGYMWWGGYGYM